MDQTPGMKVGAAVLAGSVMTIVWWILGETAGVHPPTEVASASVVLLSAVGIFLAPERIVPRSSKEQLIREGWRPAPADLHLVERVKAKEARR